MNMILETERLSLREMNDDDFADLCEMLQDPVVMTAYEHAFEDEETRQWLENQKDATVKMVLVCGPCCSKKPEK